VKALIEDLPGGRPMMDPYIVWDTVGKRDTPSLLRLKLQGGMGNFEVLIEEMGFNITRSQPTGRENLAIKTITTEAGGNKFIPANDNAENAG
jgi:hypothetical protein